jgi:hypothetical protein
MLTASLGYGGAEGSFTRLARYLSRSADVKIALMARDYGGGGYSSAQSEVALPIVLLDGETKHTKSPLAKIGRWRRMRRRLAELKTEHDVTISFMSGPNLLNSLAGSRGRTLISERGSKRFDTSSGKIVRTLWLQFLDPIAYHGSARIVAASQGLAGEITGSYPTLASQVIAIEGTANTTELFEASEADVPQAFLEFQCYRSVVAFGRMHQQKGYDFLLKVFHSVLRREPDARLLLIGDGPEMAAYEKLAERLGLRAGREPTPSRYDVVFAGYQSAPLRFLKLGRVFALPSRYEGLPNALIECLASGIPVLAADCPWGPRSILSGPEERSFAEELSTPIKLAHGMLMPRPDTLEGEKAWEFELLKALNEPFYRRPMDQRRAAINRFDIEESGPQWLRVIEDIIDRHA